MSFALANNQQVEIMNAIRVFARLAAIASSLLLVAGYVSYRAGYFQRVVLALHPVDGFKRVSTKGDEVKFHWNSIGTYDSDYAAIVPVKGHSLEQNLMEQIAGESAVPFQSNQTTMSSAEKFKLPNVSAAEQAINAVTFNGPPRGGNLVRADNALPLAPLPVLTAAHSSKSLVMSWSTTHLADVPRDREWEKATREQRRAAALATPEAQFAAATRYFNWFDANDDGKLTKGELSESDWRKLQQAGAINDDSISHEALSKHFVAVRPSLTW